MGNGLFLEQQAVNSPIYGGRISCLLFECCSEVCCAISLDIKQSQFYQFDVMSSMEGTKAGSMCLHFGGVCCEWAGEGSRHGRGLKFSSVLISWQNCNGGSSCFFWMLAPLFHGAWHFFTTCGVWEKRWVSKSNKSIRHRSVASLTVEAMALSLNQAAAWADGYLVLGYFKCFQVFCFLELSLIWRYNVFKDLHSINHMCSSSS